MFQTSINRPPFFDRATTPPTSHPTLQPLATFAVTGIGPISVSPETIESTPHSIKAGGGDPLLRDELTDLGTAFPEDHRRRRQESSNLRGAIHATG